LNLLPCPILLSTKELRDAMVREPSITSIAKMVGLASMSVVGIGGISDNATIQKNGMLTKSDFELLRMRGSVGDILCHFIDVDGNPLDTDIESRIVSTSLSALERMSNVVAAAGGDEKVRAIRAVLRHGYVNALITDERTARKVIEEDDRLKEMVP
ncbi:MAG: sugar-binding transcriptional regulator, partial [Coriobacteriaceae bacterium]|nr:sugar-binding transcriptional regulator [Coriobacteriaceae bacterium]